jgi:predicted enzyme related to lactoylglutathione lyase
MKNAINWFEIPVKDLERAKKFYEAVMGGDEMQVMDGMGMKSAFFNADMENGVGGCLVEGEGYEPTTSGSLVYLNGGEDLNTPLGKVEAAGGKIVLPKTAIGPNGFMAFFTDTEGNKIGLHSMQ